MSLKRLSALKFPLNISGTAWNKMKHILSKGNNSGFLFFASGGGCNGYNYKLEPIDKLEFESLKEENPTIIYDDTNTPLMIDPTSELLLMGTSIDFIEEDYAKNIFESRFFFTPQKDLASSCGCGVSFSPKEPIKSDQDIL